MGITIKSDEFGIHSSGLPVTCYTLENDDLVKVQIINLGGIVTSVMVPDKHGNYEDIVTGFNTVAEYEVNPAYFGALIGRVGNRINQGKFLLDGVEYSVSTNRPPIHLHGGNSGFDKKLWKGEVTADNKLRLTYISVDGEEGYPGTLEAVVTYQLTSQNELFIHYSATCDKQTIVNMTNHSYFNLAGHKSGSIADHVLSVKGDHYLEKDSNNCPTGKLIDVSGTPYDLRSGAVLKDRLSIVGGEPSGYDHNFCLTGTTPAGEGRSLAATLTHPGSGRVLEVFTDQPGIQVYTGNYLNGLNGKDGATYGQHSCIALETQNYPDAIHHEHFPSMVLRPGEQYKHNTWFRFSVKK